MHFKGMPPTNIRQNEYAPTKAYISLRNQYEKNGEILGRAWWLFMSFGIPIGEKDVFNAKTEEVWLNFKFYFAPNNGFVQLMMFIVV